MFALLSGAGHFTLKMGFIFARAFKENILLGFFPA